MTAGPHFLNWQVHDATLRFLAAPRDEKFRRAQKVVEAKFARGDYPVLQALDEQTRDNLAQAMVNDLLSPRELPKSGA